MFPCYRVTVQICRVSCVLSPVSVVYCMSVTLAFTSSFVDICFCLPFVFYKPSAKVPFSQQTTYNQTRTVFSFPPISLYPYTSFPHTFLHHVDLPLHFLQSLVELPAGFQNDLDHLGHRSIAAVCFQRIIGDLFDFIAGIRDCK